uniref:Uncharacterized protein n=1 Tax=Oryza nivara TaxID=4536 RepID=A0A0E0H063_ORYNI
MEGICKGIAVALERDLEDMAVMLNAKAGGVTWVLAIRWERQPSVMVLAPNCLLVTLKMVGPYMRANKVISRFKLSFYLFFFQIDVL